jgi:hypothetical protein
MTKRSDTESPGRRTAKHVMLPALSRMGPEFMRPDAPIVVLAAVAGFARTIISATTTFDAMHSYPAWMANTVLWGIVLSLFYKRFESAWLRGITFVFALVALESPRSSQAADFLYLYMVNGLAFALICGAVLLLPPKTERHESS